MLPDVPQQDQTSRLCLSSCEDQVLVTELLTDLGYELPEGSLEAVVKDLHEVGIEAFKESLPERTNVHKKAAFSRFLKCLAADASQLPGCERQGFQLKGPGLEEPWLEEQRRLRHKATVGELAEKLDIGTFAAVVLPSQELLAKATTAAQLGHFLPPAEGGRQEFCKRPTCAAQDRSCWFVAAPDVSGSIVFGAGHCVRRGH